MAKRRAITKKVRFEVFKRDSFTCKYCGASAPTVVLCIDHIQPVSKGGDNDILNLITACEPCNAGKSNRLLTDDSIVTQQKAQLDELQSRREQIEMMLEWRNGLKSLDADNIEAAVQAFDAITPGWSSNEVGKKGIARLVKKHGLELVLKAIDIADTQYIELNQAGKAISESADLAYSKLPGICKGLLMPEWKRELFHIRNIARTRAGGWWQNSTSADVFKMFHTAYDEGYSLETLKNLAIKGLSYNELHETLTNWIDDARRRRKAEAQAEREPETLARAEPPYADFVIGANAVDYLQAVGEM